MSGLFEPFGLQEWEDQLIGPSPKAQKVRDQQDLAASMVAVANEFRRLEVNEKAVKEKYGEQLVNYAVALTRIIKTGALSQILFDYKYMPVLDLLQLYTTELQTTMNALPESVDKTKWHAQFIADMIRYTK